MNQKWVIKIQRYKHKKPHVLLFQWYYQYKKFWSR